MFGAWGPIQLKAFRETVELTLQVCVTEPANWGIYPPILFPYQLRVNWIPTRRRPRKCLCPENTQAGRCRKPSAFWELSRVASSMDQRDREVCPHLLLPCTLTVWLPLLWWCGVPLPQHLLPVISTPLPWYHTLQLSPVFLIPFGTCRHDNAFATLEPVIHWFNYPSSVTYLLQVNMSILRYYYNHSFCIFLQLPYRPL